MDTPTILAALLSGGVIGLILGLVGGGGSIMAVPLLIYVVGVGSPHAAIGTASVAVTTNALASLIGHARAGRVKWRCAGVFAVSGMAGLLFWLVALPILLIGFGVWQVDRAAVTQADVESVGRNLAQTLSELRPIAAETPDEMLRFESGQVYPASTAVGRVEDAIWENDLLLQVSAVRYPFAYLTIVGGALTLAGGGCGLLLSSLAGRRARLSREQLLQSFTRLRLLLPFMLAAVILGLGLGGLGASLFETMTLPFWGEVSAGAWKLAIAGLVLVGLALYCAASAVRGLRRAFALIEPEPIEERARAVTQAEAPDLWRFIGLVAERVEADVPDTLVAGLTGGFYVTECPVRLLPEDRVITGRTLHVPALLELLDAPEIAAIIGHELAHFAGEDTRYSQRFVPIYSSLRRSLGALHEADPRGDFGIGAGLRLGYHALSRFDTAVAHWSRLREFEADRRGSLASTPSGAVSALVRIHVADAAVQTVLSEAFRGRVDFGPDLVAAVGQFAAREGLSDPAEHLKDRQPHPTDSHPPTNQRIAALGAPLDETLLAHVTRRPQDGAPSFGRRTVADWDAFCRDLSTDFLQNAQTVRAELHEQLETAVAGIGEDEIVLFENSGPLGKAMVFLAGLFIVAIACVYLLPDQFGFGRSETTKAILAGVLVAGILVSLAGSRYFQRRASRPLMILTPETLVSHWLNEPVRWLDIEWYQVVVASRVALQLGIAEGAPFPTKAHPSIYNRTKRKKRIVELDALGIRGLHPDEFSQLVGRYLAAADARRTLSIYAT